MSFYVHKGRSGWRLIEETWALGKKTQKTVPKQGYEPLGVRSDMSLEEVRAYIKTLNTSRSLQAQRIAKGARRMQESRIVASVFIPEDLEREFFKKIQEESFGGDKNNNRLLSHWKYIQIMITELQIEPVEYGDRAKAFYKYFIEKKNSLDYVNKLIRILNMWGLFICKKRGQFFEAVKAPKGKIREMINDAYTESDNFIGESDPLTPELLTQAKDKFKVPGNYEWLWISTWFGLRPEEVDSLKDQAKWKVEHRKDKCPVLWVYQSKLTSIAKEKRWKGIPMLYPEQLEALKLIQDGIFKRPIHKTMRKTFKGFVTLYGGRKNFQDMMLNKGHILEDISMWMGHQNIQTTWTKYRNRKRVGG